MARSVQGPLRATAKKILAFVRKKRAKDLDWYQETGKDKEDKEFTKLMATFEKLVADVEPMYHHAGGFVFYELFSRALKKLESGQNPKEYERPEEEFLKSLLDSLARSVSPWLVIAPVDNLRLRSNTHKRAHKQRLDPFVLMPELGTRTSVSKRARVFWSRIAKYLSGPRKGCDFDTYLYKHFDTKFRPSMKDDVKKRRPPYARCFLHRTSDSRSSKDPASKLRAAPKCQHLVPRPGFT